MANNNYDVTRLLIDEVNMDVKIAAKKVADEIGKEIEELYESVIDKFYADYPNPMYDRTYSTYMASSGFSDLLSPLMPVLSYPLDNGNYMAGIVVDPINIKGDPYNKSLKKRKRKKKYSAKQRNEWIFNRTFYEGKHGITKGEAKKWKWKFKTITPMSPHPVTIMDRIFKRHITQEHVNDLFNMYF